MTLTGIIPPVVTLLDEHGQIDVDKNKQMLDFLIEQGVHGLLLLGSSGEFPHFSFAEKQAYLTEIIPYVKDRVPVLVGTGGTVIEETIALSNHAAHLGAAGVLVVNPYYWTMADEQLVSYFDTIAKAIHTDLYLYNIPQLTGQDIPVDVIVEVVARNANVRGIKETVASLSRIRLVIEQVANRFTQFSVYSAFDEQLLDAQIAGAAGSINGTSVFFPEASVRLYDAIAKKDFAAIQHHHQQLTTLMAIYSWHPSYFLSMKEALYARLFPTETVPMRAPFIYTSPNLRELAQALLQELSIKGGAQ